jgi:hypothetical protein
MYKIFAFFTLALMCTFSLTSMTYAAYSGPYAEVCADNPSATVCRDQQGTVSGGPSPIYGPNGVLSRVANILAIVAGVIAVVMIMVSGLKMITSSGDAKKFSDARNGIIYAAVGIVVVALARVIIEFILRLIG